MKHCVLLALVSKVNPVPAVASLKAVLILTAGCAKGAAVFRTDIGKSSSKSCQPMSDSCLLGNQLV